jgi:hypothetical protein
MIKNILIGHNGRPLRLPENRTPKARIVVQQERKVATIEMDMPKSLDELQLVMLARGIGASQIHRVESVNPGFGSMALAWPD